MSNGIFINYQMAEAITLLTDPHLLAEQGYASTEEALSDLKNRWLKDVIPGYKCEIGHNMPGMQEITVEEVFQLAELAKTVDTYTVQNSGAMQYCIQFNEDGSYNFDFSKLEKIVSLARQNNKKIIIDSAVVFGDLKNNNLKHLSTEQLANIIKNYIAKLTTKYGDVIERIDVFNAVFQRNEIDHDNYSEKFWIERFGENYPEHIIKLVRENINSVYKDKIKLCWNEFYLTNSNEKYKGRREAFLERIKNLDIDCIGIQDRFTTGTSEEYITSSLQEIISMCEESGKSACITEFSCTASGNDRMTLSNEDINKKVKVILQTVKNIVNNTNTITSIEGAASDKFDYNHHELISDDKNPINISTTDKKELKPKEINAELSIMFVEQKQEEKPKVKQLTPNNNGFTNYLILILSGVVCVLITMIINLLIKYNGGKLW